ncbi:amidohydrolase family protein [Mucisphaera calidilacus]|uniref:Adenosine deaminase n=1 Tax=Mucisphaera calidilacus TaxID=2527982 RepID=A0A518BV58_9BACT|nr:amidohydrolase family protein [Mucisphaera calidilacus]QDU70870.1 Adenosine deaminase [Mucisphaera calidilacus]
MNNADRKVYVASWVRDAGGVSLHPGAVVVEADPSGSRRVVAVGDPDALRGEGEVIDLGAGVLMPAMVNAHAHLELSSIGQWSYDRDRGFFGWVQRVGEATREASVFEEGPGYRSAVAEGLRLSAEAGVAAVGDIARHRSALSERLDSGMLGVTFLELFGIGEPHQQGALERVAAGGAEGAGWQPHAPYSAGQGVYEAAARSGLPVSTHFSELPAELDFVARAEGPCRVYLETIGKWSRDTEARYCQGWSPAYWMEPALRARPWVLAHAHYVDDRDIKLLADSGASVAYCPVAGEYFEHPRGDREPHRYREMLEAGVNVCLGTDSLVCQPEGEPQPLGILPQMRRLWRRDQTDPGLLLEMATVRGARALGLDEGLFTFESGPIAGMLFAGLDGSDEEDGLRRVLDGETAAKPL